MKNQFSPKKNRVFIALFVFVLLFSMLPVGALANSNYPADTEKTNAEPAGDIMLTKHTEWTDKPNGNAVVDLTFNGLQSTYQFAQPMDVVFNLDVSASMSEDDGCLNTTHTTYPMYNMKTRFAGIFMDNLSVNFDSYATFKAFFSDFIDQAILNSELPVSASDPVDPQLRLAVPTANIQAAGSYVNAESDFYFVIKKDVVATAANLQNADNWMVVDFGNPLGEIPQTLLGIRYYGADETSAAIDSYIYHTDESDQRIYHISAGSEIVSFPDDSYFPVADKNASIYPEWWQADCGCITRAEIMYNSISYLAEMILDSNPESRVAFSTFAGAARSVNGLALDYMNFTTSYSDFVANLENAVAFSALPKTRPEAVYTNYEAGVLSSKQIFDDDTANSSNAPILISFTDGRPNSYCSDGDYTVNAGYNDGSGKQRTNVTAAMDALLAQYPELTAHAMWASGSGNGDLNALTHLLITDGGKNYEITSDRDLQDAFDNIVEKLFTEIIIKTKIVSITDYIDNRYFTVDEAALNANANNAYFDSANCSVTVTSETQDGIAVQKVRFSFSSDDLDLDAVKVSIPLNFVTGAVPPNADNYYPTNYDQSPGGGAFAEYYDLEREPQTLHTLRVWLDRDAETTPTKPVDPSVTTPTNPATTTPAATIPNTGDANNAAIWTAAMPLCGLAVALSVRLRGKRTNSNI